MEKLNRQGKRFTWAQYGCILFFALIPFVYATKGVDPVLLPRQIYVSVFIVLMAGYFLLKGSKQFSVVSIFPLLLVMLAIAYTVSVLSAINVIESRYIVIKIYVFVGFFMVMYAAIQAQLFTIQSISLGIAISGLVAAILAMRDLLYLQSLGIDVFADDNLYKVKATFGHKNLLSSYLFLCLPMLLIQWVYAINRTQKVLVALGVLFVLGVIVMLQTRAVLLAAIICSGIAMVLFVTNRMLTSSLQKRGILICVGLALIVMVTGYTYREKFATITRTESFIERAHVWQNTWQMIQEHPVTGVGAANWQIHFPQYGMQKFYDVNYMVTEGLTNFQRPHNDFLWVWAETGTIGFVVYALMLVLGCVYAFKLYKKGQANDRFVSVMLLLQFVGFIIISLVDFPLERIEHPIVLLAGLAYVAAVFPSTFIRLQVSKWVWLVGIVVGLYSLFICNHRWQSEQQMRKVYKAHTSGNWAKMVTEAQKAQTPFFNMDYFSIPLSWYIGVGYFMQNNVQSAKQYFEQAYGLHPYQVHVLNNYGACYEKDGDHTKAIELLETANRISPSFSDGIINLSGAYFNAGRYEDAYRKIGTIGYDEDNPRLKTFVLTIVKKKLELTIQQNTGTVYATSLEKLRTNDAAVLVCFKNARAEHVDLMDYLNNRLKDTPAGSEVK